jgi:hypothetical protein
MTENPKLEKLRDGLYTIRDYKRPESLTPADLRKAAEQARKVQITVPDQHDKNEQ